MAELYPIHRPPYKPGFNSVLYQSNPYFSATIEPWFPLENQALSKNTKKRRYRTAPCVLARTDHKNKKGMYMSTHPYEQSLSGQPPGADEDVGQNPKNLRWKARRNPDRQPQKGSVRRLIPFPSVPWVLYRFSQNCLRSNTKATPIRHANYSTLLFVKETKNQNYHNKEIRAQFISFFS